MYSLVQYQEAYNLRNSAQQGILRGAAGPHKSLSHLHTEMDRVKMRSPPLAPATEVRLSALFQDKACFDRLTDPTPPRLRPPPQPPSRGGLQLQPPRQNPPPASSFSPQEGPLLPTRNVPGPDLPRRDPAHPPHDHHTSRRSSRRRQGSTPTPATTTTTTTTTASSKGPKAKKAAPPPPPAKSFAAVAATGPPPPQEGWTKVSKTKKARAPPLFKPDFTKVQRELIVELSSPIPTGITDYAIITAANASLASTEVKFCLAHRTTRGKVLLLTGPNITASSAEAYIPSLSSTLNALGCKCSTIHSNSRWTQFLLHGVPTPTTPQQIAEEIREVYPSLLQ
ncbi:hypothetical protein Q9L58_010437 [Maublancomyces gigas]|uniref:Uncharacterized protein n=1 Tax=Discina gigas TaxID=1032678 RepID=A0ABR3G432_9PEZI